MPRKERFTSKSMDLFIIIKFFSSVIRMAVFLPYKGTIVTVGRIFRVGAV